MWDKLAQINGGEKNMLRVAKSLRGKFDDMRIKGEIIAHYYG